MPSIVQELDKLIAQAGGTPSGSGLSINEKLKQLNGLIGGTPANIFTYKGSVATADLLPTSGQSVGDVYNIISESDYGPAGTNVAWAGEAWDALGGSSSGSDALVVIFTKSGSTYSVNATSSEIYEAWSSERQIVAIDKDALAYLKVARIGMHQSLFYSNVEFSTGPNYSGTLSDRKYEIRWDGSRDNVLVSNRTIQVPNASNLASKTYCLSYYYDYDEHVYDKTKKILTSVSGAPIDSMSGFVYEYESQGINIIDVTDPRANFDFDTQTDSAYNYYFSISGGSSDYIVPNGIIKHVSSISNYISDEQGGGTAKLVLSGFDSSLSDVKEEYTITASYDQDYACNCIIFTDRQESSGGTASEGLFYIKVERDSRGNYTLISDIDDVAKEIVKERPMLAAILYTTASGTTNRKATLCTLGNYNKYQTYVYLTFATLDDVQPNSSSDVSSTFSCESFTLQFTFSDTSFTGTPTYRSYRRFLGSITAVGPSGIKQPVQIAGLFYKWNDQSDVYDMTRKELVGPYRLHDWRVFPYGNDAGTTRIDELLEDFYNNNIYVIDYTDSRDSSFDYTDPTNYLYASSDEAGSGQFYDLISADAAKYKPLGVVKKLVSVGYSDNGNDQKCDIVLEYFDSTQSKMVYDTVQIEFTDYTNS